MGASWVWHRWVVKFGNGCTRLRRSEPEGGPETVMLRLGAQLILPSRCSAPSESHLLPSAPFRINLFSLGHTGFEVANHANH